MLLRSLEEVYLVAEHQDKLDCVNFDEGMSLIVGKVAHKVASKKPVNV